LGAELSEMIYKVQYAGIENEGEAVVCDYYTIRDNWIDFRGEQGGSILLVRSERINEIRKVD
jgi:hypothetical protein